MFLVRSIAQASGMVGRPCHNLGAGEWHGRETKGAGEWHGRETKPQRPEHCAFVAHAPRIQRTGCGGQMIKLTRLGGEVFVLNADLIRYVEARPDTFITLTNN